MIRSHIVMALVVMVGGGGASAGPIAPERPSFCQGHTAEPHTNRYIDTTSSDALTNEAIGRMAMYACDAPDDAEHQKKTAEYRQLLADAFGLSPAMTIESLRARLDWPAFQKESAALCTKIKKQDDVTERENRYNAALAVLAGCERNFGGFWLLDEQGDVSQVWRVAELFAIYMPGRVDKFDDAKDSAAGKDAVSLTEYARSMVDIAALDSNKLIAELDANKAVTPRVKVAMLENVDQTIAWTSKVTAAYKAMAAKNHAYQEALFDLPQKAFDDWQSTYHAYQKDFDLVIDVERRASLGKSAVKGCAAKLRPGFARYVTARKIKTADDVEAFARDSFGVRWLKALSFCEHVDGNAPLSVFLSREIKDDGLRGPRTNAELAGAKRVAEILADKNIPMDHSGIFTHLLDDEGSKVFNAFSPRDNVTPSGASGTIKSVSKTGDLVHVTFAAETWSEPSMDCVDTKTIERIDADTGHVQYRRKCKPGPAQKKSTKEDPIDVPAFYGSGLKAGQFLEFVVPASGPRSALPLVGFADHKKTKVASVFGLAP